MTADELDQEAAEFIKDPTKRVMKDYKTASSDRVASRRAEFTFVRPRSSRGIASEIDRAAVGTVAGSSASQ